MKLFFDSRDDRVLEQRGMPLLYWLDDLGASRWIRRRSRTMASCSLGLARSRIIAASSPAGLASETVPRSGRRCFGLIASWNRWQARASNCRCPGRGSSGRATRSPRAWSFRSS